MRVFTQLRWSVRLCVTAGVIAGASLTIPVVAGASVAASGANGVGHGSNSAVTALTYVVGEGSQCSTTCLTNVSSDADWILRNQDATGWIGMAPPTTTIGLLIQPYSAAYASMGLSDAFGATGSNTYDNAAWNWLAWDKAQMAANAPRTSGQLKTCSTQDVATTESPTSNVSCFYTPAYCANISAGVTAYPYGANDARSCTGVAGVDYAPVVESYPNSLVTHPYMDSTDATAGMFLVALQAAYNNELNAPGAGTTSRTRAFNLLSALNTLVPGCRAAVCGTDVINEAVIAIHSTLDTDGLTWAQPWYQAKYLEDLSETYAGLRAAANLESALAASATSSSVRTAESAIGNQASTMANAMYATVNNLWSTTASIGGAGYGWAVFPSGYVQQTNWTNPVGSTTQIYGDPQQNAWAVMWGIASSTNASSVTSTFDANFGPTSTTASAYWNFPTPSGAYPSPLYWVGVTNALNGNASVASAAVAQENSIYQSTRIWQYQPEDAGMAIWAEILTGV